MAGQTVNTYQLHTVRFGDPDFLGIKIIERDSQKILAYGIVDKIYGHIQSKCVHPDYRQLLDEYFTGRLIDLFFRIQKRRTDGKPISNQSTHKFFCYCLAHNLLEEPKPGDDQQQLIIPWEKVCIEV